MPFLKTVLSLSFVGTALYASASLASDMSEQETRLHLLKQHMPEEAINTLLNEQRVVASAKETLDVALTSDELSYEVIERDASFIKVHFSDILLYDGDSIEVANPEGTESYIYTAADIDNEELWALSISGNAATIKLNNISNKASVKIDSYNRGFSELVMTEQDATIASLCGSTDFQDAICYQGSHSTHYQRSRPVAKLFNGGAGDGTICTAWRVGPRDDTMLTNQHCLENASYINGAEVWFDFDNNSCGGNRIGNNNRKIVKVAAREMLYFNDGTGTDIALFTINNPSAAAAFGALELDTARPAVGDEIYIPQHPSGVPKVISIFDSSSSTGLCKVDALTFSGTNIAYNCDTQGGSSGSPVLSASTHRVVGLHHYGGCYNDATIFANLEPLIRNHLTVASAPTPAPVPSTAPPSPTECGEFGIAYVNDTTLKVFHADEGWSANFNYLCLNGACYPGTLNNGYYEREFSGQLNASYEIEFKVQDDATSQYITSKQSVFSQGCQL